MYAGFELKLVKFNKFDIYTVDKRNSLSSRYDHAVRWNLYAVVIQL
jgi:hypothetical protein